MLAGICSFDFVSALTVRGRILWDAVPWVIMLFFINCALPPIHCLLFSPPGHMLLPAHRVAQGKNTPHLLILPSFLQAAYFCRLYLT